VPNTRTILGWVLLAVACAMAGCCRSRPFWRDPPPPLLLSSGSWGSCCAHADQRQGKAAADTTVEGLRQRYAATRDPLVAYGLAEAYVRLAVAAEQTDPGASPDLYYQAAAFSWVALRDGTASTQHWQRARDVYHASVARMLVTARGCGRNVAGGGLMVFPAGRPTEIRYAAHGFYWQLDDFQELYPVGEYRTDMISRRHWTAGWGVPIVVKRAHRTGGYAEEAFLASRSAFAATVVLRPDVEALLDGPCATMTDATLDFYSPLTKKTAPRHGCEVPLATDITAPFAFLAVTDPSMRDRIAWFLYPTRSKSDGLYMIEPYQRGKIPVVFSHGLLSNPATWMDLANDLRSVPGFTDRYQVWAFRYATGSPFLEAAAILRRDLHSIVATADPDDQDPALHNMVLLGHSMGGLVSKLQVVNSGNRLWQAAASRPFEQIAVDNKTRTRLAEMFFFPPNPRVRRVIFIATPHQGSCWAQRPVGRFAACMVRPDPADVERHRQMIAANPGVFSAEIQSRIPTSIDMLEPDSAILHAIRCLPVDSRVAAHSIIGTKCSLPFQGPGDSVVSLSSATHPCVASQLAVPATHTKVHRHPQTTAEVARILREHLLQMACQP
jgi:pimeloyl-ACP methyl ester carboxylesterase